MSHASICIDQRRLRFLPPAAPPGALPGVACGGPASLRSNPDSQLSSAALPHLGRLVCRAARSVVYSVLSSVGLGLSGRDDVALPVEALAPVLARAQPPHHGHHLGRRVRRLEQLLVAAPVRVPEGAAEVGPHRARVVRHGERPVAAPHLQPHVEALGHAVDRRLARPVRVPPARAVVRHGPDPRGHEHPGRVCRQPVSGSSSSSSSSSRSSTRGGGRGGGRGCSSGGSGVKIRRASGQKLGKVLRQQQRPDRVDLEHGAARGRVNLGRALLRRQDARDGQRQVQVVRGRVEELSGPDGRGADRRLVPDVDVHRVQPLVPQDTAVIIIIIIIMLAVPALVPVVAAAAAVAVPHRGEDRRRCRLQQMAREMAADAAAGRTHKDPRPRRHFSSLLPLSSSSGDLLDVRSFSISFSLGGAIEDSGEKEARGKLSNSLVDRVLAILQG
ncbi:hypothetical protein AAL_07152 [Moelleriella libera RCEF 2490]|uniref:Uncharacterized protein n=1 Tax=Moelleriella libera RCEF 2490 TaxID=1081109 RepID=A0A167XU20_9HYPO|nr:hypothetical protein AAL_07152 [Moelleriella libera RCEF 2490]